MDVEPRHADVVGVVKFVGIELARFKRAHKCVVAQGRSSEVEFHREPLSVKMLGNKEKGPDPKIGSTFRSIPRLLAGLRNGERPTPATLPAPTLNLQL